MKLFILLSIVLLNPTVDRQNDEPSNGIDFFSGSWTEVLEEAEQSGKAIFVDAYAVWCGPCKWMNAYVFTNGSVAKYYNNNFINYKFDMEKGEGRSFARKYNIIYYPTLLYFSSEGKEIKREVGGKASDQFILIGKSVVKNIKNS